MNSTHSSELVAGLLGLVLALAVCTSGAAAVEFEGDAPDAAEVGTELDVDGVTMTAPFDVGDPWTMEVRTDLEEPRQLVVRTVDGAGDTVEEIDTNESTVQLELDSDDGVSAVEFEVRGSVPSIRNGPGGFSYDDRDRENISLLAVVEVFEGQTTQIANGTFDLYRFTQDSRAARQAIENASAAADEAGSSEARERIAEAKTFYDSGEFGSAIDAANDAEDIANSEGETRQLLLLVGGVVALLVGVGGVAYLWRARQEPENKLQ